MTISNRYRDALRILFILVAGARNLKESDGQTVSGVFHGEARLHAFEFWMRNPDYLADELLGKFTESGDERYLREAETIFENDEPEVRRFPMIRYRFGAFERIDDTLAILVCRGLVRISRKALNGKVQETDFLILRPAFETAREVTASYQELAWYPSRARLIAELAGDRGGTALKQRQYEQVAYAETQLGGVIPTIAPQVRQRIRAARSEAA